MTALSDITIRQMIASGELGITPYDEKLIQPASLDVRIGNSFRVFHNHRTPAIDLREPPRGLTEQVVIDPDEPFVIHPGEFCLADTLERVRIPDNLLCRIEGRSSIGRLGLIVHATAGFIDPGFEGTITLELANLTRIPIKLYSGLTVAQLTFQYLDRPAEVPYGHPDLGSHYQGQSGATESRYGQ